MKNIRYLIIFILLAFSNLTCDNERNNITILSWPGYEEDEIVKMIKNKIGNDYQINFITYTGGEDMLKKFETNKERIDLIVADAEYGKILYAKNEIQLLDFTSNSTITNNFNNYFAPFLSSKFNPTSSRSEVPPGYDNMGTPYCLIIRWGTVSLVADTSLKKQIDSIGYNVLSNIEFKNKIVIFDWYLPNMGIFALDYLNKHHIKKNPYDLNREELENLYSEIMQPLKVNIKAFYSDLGKVIENVYEKDVMIIPGIGEWAIGNKYLEGNLEKNWFIPKNQNSLIWIESLAIPKHVIGNKKTKIMQILELFSSPELQKELAWRNAYTSQVPNKKAYELMNKEQKDFLRFSEVENILNQSFYRKVPDETNLPIWLDLWAKFKN